MSEENMKCHYKPHSLPIVQYCEDLEMNQAILHRETVPGFNVKSISLANGNDALQQHELQVMYVCITQNNIFVCILSYYPISKSPAIIVDEYSLKIAIPSLCCLVQLVGRSSKWQQEAHDCYLQEHRLLMQHNGQE